MRRRVFIQLLGSAAAAWPLAINAQQQGGMRRLGFLSVGTGSDAFSRDIVAAFSQGLGALGWKEGVNLAIDWRWLGADAALGERQAAELIALKPDVLLGGGNIGFEKLREQTKTIPLYSLSSAIQSEWATWRVSRIPVATLPGLPASTRRITHGSCNCLPRSHHRLQPWQFSTTLKPHHTPGACCGRWTVRPTRWA